MLAAIVLAFCGFSVINPQSPLSPKHAWFWVLSASVACVGLFYALIVGGDINEAYGIGRPAIASPFIKRDGHIEPFSSHDAQRPCAIRASRRMTPRPTALADDVATKAYLAFLPVLLFLGVYARYIFAGYHYFFARYPAEAVVAPALRSGNLFDKDKLADALRSDPREFTDHPPIHQTQNLLRRARLLRDK